MVNIRRQVSNLAAEEWDLQPPNTNCRQLLVIGASTLLLVTFSAGAFNVVEYEPAREARSNYRSEMAALLNRGNFTADQSRIVERIITLHGQHWCSTHMLHDDPWNFWSAFYFTMVLISTVGYGDLAPETSIGKVLAVVVSLVGIPLLLSFYLPLSRWFVDNITGMVRRLYISRAVERAMEAVRLTSTRANDDSFARVDFSRRVPDSGGVGLSQKDVWRVELASLLLILLLLTVSILGLAPCLATYQSWSLADAFSFIWYTMTTIGLGDVTVAPRHPLLAAGVLLLLLFIGASAGRAIVCSVQRGAAFLEQFLSSAPGIHGSEISVFTEALDRLTNSSASAVELDQAGAENLVSGQGRPDGQELGIS